MGLILKLLGGSIILTGFMSIFYIMITGVHGGAGPSIVVMLIGGFIYAAGDL